MSELTSARKAYFRCMVHLKPSNWTWWLPLEEWWYNSSYPTALKMLPFEALHGYAPPFLPMLSVNNLKVGVVGEFIYERQQFSQLLKENLLKAQNRMK